MAKQVAGSQAGNGLNSWVVEKMKKMTAKLGEAEAADDKLEVLDSYSLAMSAAKEALTAFGAPETAMVAIDKFVGVVEAKAGAIEAENEFAQSLAGEAE